LRIAPPVGRSDFHRIEFDEVASGAFTLAGHGKRDGGLSAVVRQRKAERVELQVLEGGSGAFVFTAQRAAFPHDRVARRFVRRAAGGLEASAGLGAEQVGEARGLARAQIDHAAAGGMPRLAAREIDVDMVLVREVRTEHVENVDLGRRARARIRLAFLVRLERAFIRM